MTDVLPQVREAETGERSSEQPAERRKSLSLSSGNALERVFFLVSAYCRIPLTTAAFIQLFQETSAWVFQESMRQGMFRYLLVRCSWRRFETRAATMVAKLYEVRRVEFMLRQAAADRLVELPCAEIPGYLAQVENLFLEQYIQNLPDGVDLDFVVGQYLRLRAVWFRDLLLRLLPALLVVAALVFAAMSMLTISGGGVTLGGNLIENWRELISAMIGR